MRAGSIAALAAGLSGVRAAIAPLCKACEQSECLDSVIKEECGEYLVIVETPATSTIVETVQATVVPTETTFVSVSTTAHNNVTTTINVSASQTIDFTVTVIESETATETDTVTETETETETVTGAPSPSTTVGPVKRHAYTVDRYGYDVPEYARCDDIYEYSSACDCAGFVPSTSTAPAPSTTTTVTETVTPSTVIVTETIATLSFTRNVTTLPVTATVTTVSISQAVDTVTETTVVATTTDTVTETTTETTTFTETPTLPPPRPTYSARIFERDASANQVEDIRIPPGAEIGVITTIRQTTTPATFVITPDGDVTLSQSPATTVPYKWYYYSRNTAFSYIQTTTSRVANILGVQLVDCKVGAANALECYTVDGSKADLWTCGRHLALVFAADQGAFQRSCVNGARKVNLEVEVLGTT